MSKVLKTIVNVILFCAIVVAAGLLIPPFAGITTVMVDDIDMQTNLSGRQTICICGRQYRWQQCGTG